MKAMKGADEIGDTKTRYASNAKNGPSLHTEVGM
jgi:hypothetical protein